MLRERNKSYGTIKFVDISSDDYSPEENQGLDYETVSKMKVSFLLLIVCFTSYACLSTSNMIRNAISCV